MPTRHRESVRLDKRGRAYLARLGFAAEETLVWEPVEGDDTAWVVRPGRLLTDVEIAILSNPDNVAALRQAISEVEAGEELLEITEGFPTPAR